eukprot:6493513-Alexandrium_andersonii.AAC.1
MGAASAADAADDPSSGEAAQLAGPDAPPPDQASATGQLAEHLDEAEAHLDETGTSESLSDGQ